MSRLSLPAGWLVLFVGCAYHPDSFTSFTGPFLGTRAVVGCLDVTLRERRDPHTTSAVVEYSFGNRCDHGVLVDLASVRVRGRSAAREIELVAFDPRGEIRPLPMDGGWTGHEVIEYRPMGSEPDPILGLCVDVGTIDHARTGERWVCTSTSAGELGS